MHSDSHSSTHGSGHTRTHKCATISGFHKVLQNPHSLQHGSKHSYTHTGDTIKSLLLTLHCLPLKKKNKHTGLHKFSTCSTGSESAFTVRTYMIFGAFTPQHILNCCYSSLSRICTTSFHSSLPSTAKAD